MDKERKLINNFKAVEDNVGFIDTLFQSYYKTPVPSTGAGEFFYEPFGPPYYPPRLFNDYSDEVILSPHFITQIDLTNEPLDISNNAILTSNTFDLLINLFDQIKPVIRYLHYNILISPKSDFSSYYKSNYSSNYFGYCKTKCYTKIDDLPENIYLFHQITSSKTWTIPNFTSQLGTTYYILRIFSDDGTKTELIPNKAELIGDTLYIDFSKEVSGFCFIIAGIDEISSESSSASWLYTNNNASNGYISRIMDENKKWTIFPEEININGSNTSVTFENAKAGYILLEEGDYKHTQSSNSKSWIVNHNLNAGFVAVDIYDNSKNKIHPKSIIYLPFTTGGKTYNNKIRINFDDAVSGIAVIKKLSTQDFSKGSLINNIVKWKVGNGSNYNFDAISTNDLENVVSTGTTLTKDQDEGLEPEFFYITFDFDEEIEVNEITEIGLFDGSDNLIFYTKCKGLYKEKDTVNKFHYRISYDSI